MPATRSPKFSGPSAASKDLTHSRRATPIRLGTPADLPAAADVYRRASLSNAGNRDDLLAHPEYLILAPEGLAEGRTYVAALPGAVRPARHLPLRGPADYMQSLSYQLAAPLSDAHGNPLYKLPVPARDSPHDRSR